MDRRDNAERMGFLPHSELRTVTDTPSVAEQGEHDLQRDQHDDDDLQRLHPVPARLLDEQVVDVADGVELAADRLLPLAEVEAGGGEVEDAGEVLVADQLQGVVGPLEEAGGLDLQLADAPQGVAVVTARTPRPRGGARRPDQAVGGLEPVVEPVVDVPELQELDVGELDDLERVGAVAVGDEAGRPVERDQVVRRVRQAEPGRLERPRRRLRGPDSSRTRPAIQSAWLSSQSARASPTWKMTYSSLMSLTSNPMTAGRIRSIQGATTRRAAAVSGAGSARSPASASSSSGVIRTGNWTVSEIAPKSKSDSSAAGRLGRSTTPPGSAMPEASIGDAGAAPGGSGSIRACAAAAPAAPTRPATASGPAPGRSRNRCRRRTRGGW